MLLYVVMVKAFLVCYFPAFKVSPEKELSFSIICKTGGMTLEIKSVPFIDCFVVSQAMGQWVMKHIPHRKLFNFKHTEK